MIEYVLIGVLSGIFLLIALTYFINSKKIAQKGKPKAKKEDKPKEKVDEKKDDKKDAGEKVECPSEVIADKPVARAIQEANAEFHMKEAFEIIEQERIAFEKGAQQGKSVSGRLQLDRDEFKSELQKSLETNVISSDTNVISSATAKMDYEISSQPKEQNVDIEKQIAEEYMKKHSKNTNELADEIRNLSPEAKAILLNDVLNRKYWLVENIKQVKHKILKRCFVFDFFNEFFGEIKKGAFRYQVSDSKTIVIEGYKKVLKIESCIIVIKLAGGEMEILGDNLHVKEITANTIIIEGLIKCINQMGDGYEK